MKKIIQFTILLLAINLLVISCRKQPDVPSTSVLDTEMVAATVTGVVIDENNEPVSDATVTVGSNATTTDALGLYTFKNIQTSKNNTHVKVKKSGYFNGNRSMRILNNGETYARIKLVPKTITGTVNGTGGGSVSLATGGKVTFGANSFVETNGTIYTGTVNVAMAWIDPTAVDLGDIMQGDLRGIGTNGREAALQTYGMLGVELTGSAGQEINIASGKTAELRFPIPTSLQGGPATIPLWHFDETKGRWMEEGSVAKQGNEYVGNVTHFSFYNVDVPGYNFTYLTMNFVDNNNNPLPNLNFRLTAHSYTNVVSGTGVSNSQGQSSGYISSNLPYTLEILNSCGVTVYSTLTNGYYGPSTFIQNVTQTIIVPTTTNKTTISGIAYKCGTSDPITNGEIKVITKNGTVYNTPIASNGSYNINYFDCIYSNTDVWIEAKDNTTNYSGEPVLVNFPTGSGIANNVNLFACPSSLTEYVGAIVKGKINLWKSPTDSITKIANTQMGDVFGLEFTAGKRGALAFQSPLLVTRVTYQVTPALYPINVFKYFSNASVSPITTVSFPASSKTNITNIGTAGVGYLQGDYSINAVLRQNNINTTNPVYCKYRIKRP